MKNLKIRCPICETIGEKNTFCRTCRWFLNDSLDYYCLSPLSSEAIAKFNDNIKNYRKSWNDLAEKEQPKAKETESVALHEIKKIQDQLQEIRKEFTQRFDFLENTILNSSTNKTNTKAMLEELHQLQTDMINKENNSRELQNNFRVGSNCFFGSYPQDRDGTRKAIEWIVLTKENNKVLLTSKYALDCKPYNTREQSTTWEVCTLRKWLNNDFINSAFTSSEQKKIHTVKVSADENPNYRTNAGKETLDKIFLLSIAEVNKYFSAKNEEQCNLTEYAKAKGVYTLSGGTFWWWLRSPGKTQSLASCVNGLGETNKIGCTVDYNHFAVRPALWVDFNV